VLNLRLIFIVSLLVFSRSPLFASTIDIVDTSDSASALIAQARIKQLSKHAYWLKLLHYESWSTPSAPGTSTVISSDFFISADGRDNPQAEMEATIQALLSQPSANHNMHAQCRFIARFKWLSKRLNWEGIKIPNVTCTDFMGFSKENRVNSVSVVYATGFLSNPASFYGHPFIKFNSTSSVEQNQLLDTAVSFGAIIPKDENGLLYVYRGLFGGYIANYSDQRFYNFNHLYGENDLRDLWEYKLDLTPDEIDQILAFTWEILNKDFTYYFLKENCTLRMAELLELVIEEPLLPKRLPWSMPGTLFEYLIKVEHGGKPLVKSVTWIPSRQKRLHNKYQKLSQTSAEFAVKFSEGREFFVNNSYASLPSTEKAKILDTLIDYYEFLIIQNRSDKQLGIRKRAVLLERVKLAVESGDDETLTESKYSKFAAPPHQGPLPLMVQFGLFNNDAQVRGALIRVRPVYFDHLNIDRGRTPNSTLSTLNTELLVVRENVSLRKMDLMHVENLNVSNTPFAGDGGTAWNFKASYENHDLNCQHCLVLTVTGGFGKAYSISSPTVIFGMLDISGESTYENAENFAWLPRVGMIITPVPGWKSYFSLGRKTYFDGARSTANIVKWENRIGGNRHWDIRINYQKNIAGEYSLSTGFYW